MEYKLKQHKTEKEQNMKDVKCKLLRAVQSLRFCSLCLDNSEELHDLNTRLTNETWEEESPTVMDIAKEIFGNSVTDILLGENICNMCLESTIYSYIFIRNTKHRAQINNHYLTQMDMKIDNINTHLQKDNFSNVLIVLDDATLDTKLLSEDVKKQILGFKQLSNSPKHRATVKQTKINKETDSEETDLTDSDSNTESQSSSDGNNVTKTKKRKLKEQLPKIVIELKRYECDCCNKIFSNRSNLLAHLRLKENKKNPKKKVYLKQSLKCPQCSENPCVHTKYLISYRKQKMFQKGKIEVKCEDCDYYCFTPAALITHANKAHLNIHTHVCEACGKLLYSKNEYVRHKDFYHQQRPVCQYCDRTFYNKTCLEDHIVGCQDIERPYKCDRCPASFDTSVAHTLHVKKHNEIHPCELCLKTFTTDFRLQRHKREMHENPSKTVIVARKIVCSVCQTEFKTRKILNAHMTTHGPDEKHKCIPCKMQFPSKEEYQLHLTRNAHLQAVQKQRSKNPYKHKCTYCDYTTSAYVFYEAHVNRFHLKIAPYKCETCDKKFTSLNKLKGHIKLHSQIKPKVCDICGKRLVNATSLTKHMRIHTGEKPYACEICDMRFRSSTARDMHKERIHDGKSVSCPLCDYMTYSNRDLRSHVKKVHWKSKEKFDYKKLEGITEEHYHLFRDRRLLVLE